MKAILLSTFYCFIHLVNAQSMVQIQSDTIQYEGANIKTVNSLVYGELKSIDKAWKSFLKKKYKSKPKKTNDYYLFDDQNAIGILSDTGTLIFYTFQKEDLISLNIAYQLKNSAFLSEVNNPEDYQKLNALLKSFIYNYYDSYLPKLIKTKNKELKSLNKESENAAKANASSAKIISKNTKSMEKNSSKINKLEKKLSKSEDDEVKQNSYKNELSKVKNENAELKRVIEFNQGSLNINQGVIDKLMPQIDSLSKEINQLKLLLMEAESNVK
ncbi:MAG: hypothetical protein R2852_08165 [Bacteroidia bacterium]